MKRELGGRGRHEESSSREEKRKSSRRRRISEDYYDNYDKRPDYKVIKRKSSRRRRSEDDYVNCDKRPDQKVIKRNLSLSRYSFKSPPPNSSSCSSESNNLSVEPPNELKNLLLRFDSHCTSNDIHWYHINISKNTTINMVDQNTMVTSFNPICTIPTSSGIGRGCASAVLGSKLFMFGGFLSTPPLKECSDVFSIDFNVFNTKQQQQVSCQKETFCMLAKRCQPAAAATHGKIFIFGSNTGATLPKPWAEVFDPNFNMFSPLPDPPLYVTQSIGGIDITVVANADTILLCMKGGLFSFDVITNSWGQLSTTPLYTRGYWSFRSATLDDVLFTYSGGCVRAYDLIRDKWFKKPVLDFATMYNIDPFYLLYGHVVRIGNKTLSVVWHDQFHWYPEHSVGCVNFQVVRGINSKGKTFIRAQVHSQSDYVIPTGYCFADCLAL